MVELLDQMADNLAHQDQDPIAGPTWQAFERVLHCTGSANRQWQAVHDLKQRGHALDDPCLLGLQAQAETFSQMADSWREQLYEYLQEDHEPQVLQEIKVPRIAVQPDHPRSNRSKRRRQPGKSYTLRELGCSECGQDFADRPFVHHETDGFGGPWCLKCAVEKYDFGKSDPSKHFYFHDVGED